MISGGLEVLICWNSFPIRSKNLEKNHYSILWCIAKLLSTNVTEPAFTLREKCSNTELFLVRIYLYSDWIRRFTKYICVFTPNTGKHWPETTPYLDTFHERYLFKLNNGNTRAMCEICLKLEIHQNDVTGLFPYPLKTSKCHQLGKF